MAVPRLLWASPFCLHDTSSGAALQVKTMLEKLHERGVMVRALSALIFDSPTGTSRFPNLEKELEQNVQFFNLEEAGIPYHYMRTASRSISDLTDAEQRQFFAGYGNVLNEFQPDVIIGYGGGMLEMCIRSEARRRGIGVVYALCNGNHAQFTFPDIDMVLTDSCATANLAARREGINVMSTGTFIRPETVVASERDPKYVTFVNPAPEKGAGLAARLALMAQKELPEQRFLVIQSRGNWFATIAALHGEGVEAGSLNKDSFPNVDVAEHMSDMRPGYAATKLLLAPSLWFEGFGRVVAEAVLNHIPVLASSSGGLSEAVAGGGIILDAPECCRAEYLCMPTEEQMRPWMDALKTLLAGGAEWEEKLKQAAERHNIERSTDRALDLLLPLLQRRAGLNPQFYRSGSILQEAPLRQPEWQTAASKQALTTDQEVAKNSSGQGEDLAPAAAGAEN